MLKLILAGLIGFLLYSSDTFRTYTIEALKSVTTFIQELPKENQEKENLIKEGWMCYFKADSIPQHLFAANKLHSSITLPTSMSPEFTSAPT